jgi:3-dehydroquinate dehydratase-2
VTTIAVLNGPNLNRLGRREPEVYGSATLDEVVEMVRTHAAALGFEVVAFQSNHEGALIDEIHSYALHDAISSVPVPTVEVHISDISKREQWRRQSVITDACVGFIAGHGVQGYVEAVDLLQAHLGRGTAPGLRVVS